MNEVTLFQLNPAQLPAIVLIDTVTITPPYIHYKRKCEDYILYFILSGEMHITENNISYVLSKGDFFILDPMYEHFGTTPDTCHYFYIHFSNASFDKTILSSNQQHAFYSNIKNRNIEDKKTNNSLIKTEFLLPKYYSIPTGKQAIYHQNLYQLRSNFHSNQPLYELECSYLLQLFFLQVSRDYIHEIRYESCIRSSQTMQIILQILDYLNESFSSDIRSTDIEKNFACNFDYINRKFKQFTGKTIFVYLNDLRIHRACEYLQSGYYTLTDIAEKTGFCDVYYFSKVFKKYRGISPSEYKKSP